MDKGGDKFDSGKARLSLIPFAPLCAVADVLAFGASKYSRDNWQQVSNAKERYLDAMLRHAFAYADGETHDSESGRHHLAHAACNALFVIWFDLRGVQDANSQ